MERSYISGIVNLVDNKEVALIEAVEAGRLPISVAAQIATGKDANISQALSEAYETGQLRGRKLAAARRLIAKRIKKRQKAGKAEEVRPRADAS
jgi:ParB family chromosome partitioning protein